MGIKLLLEQRWGIYSYWGFCGRSFASWAKCNTPSNYGWCQGNSWGWNCERDGGQVGWHSLKRSGLSNIMTTITTSIGNGVDKLVNDVTTAAEAALLVLAQLSYEYALNFAFTALLSWLTFRWDAWSLAIDDKINKVVLVWLNLIKAINNWAHKNDFRLVG